MERIRKAILFVWVLSVLGVAGELLLIDHVEDVWQLLPLILIAVSLLVLAWHVIDGAHRRASTRAFQAAMLLLIASGLVGTFLHIRAKREFKLEVQPNLTGFALFWESLRGSSPPALAPGVMIQTGLLGLIWTYRHPALGVVADAHNTP